MTKNTVLLCLVAVLSVVFYQDFTRRTIHVGLPLLVFVLGLWINYNSLELNFSVIAYNGIFVLINMIGLTAYFSLKNKKLINPIDSYIGLGDIVFFLAITPLFTLKPFILFFVLGLVFSLLAHIILLFFRKIDTIPLAGYLSLCLILNVVAKNVFNINTFF